MNVEVVKAWEQKLLDLAKEGVTIENQSIHTFEALKSTLGQRSRTEKENIENEEASLKKTITDQIQLGIRGYNAAASEKVKSVIEACASLKVTAEMGDEEFMMVGGTGINESDTKCPFTMMTMERPQKR